MPEKKINIITVDPLTTDWWIGLTSTIILIFALLFIAKKLSEPNRRKFEIGMGIFLLLREVVRNWFLIYTNNWEAQTSLPLELCEFFSIASGLLFFKFNKTWYEILLLGGIAGALQSIITPELRLVFYPESIIEAYVSHGGIIF
ncbi:MAG: YwaF family protein, partial [Leptospiraceae bacterium]|nr:YwaF family protein [Leptospiraceae bacterium]